jgi:hypothetical protein
MGREIEWEGVQIKIIGEFNYKFTGFRCQVSGVSAAAGLKSGESSRKRDSTLLSLSKSEY